MPDGLVLPQAPDYSGLMGVLSQERYFKQQKELRRMDIANEYAKWERQYSAEERQRKLSVLKDMSEFMIKQNYEKEITDQVLREGQKKISTMIMQGAPQEDLWTESTNILAGANEWQNRVKTVKENAEKAAAKLPEGMDQMAFKSEYINGKLYDQTDKGKVLRSYDRIDPTTDITKEILDEHGDKLFPGGQMWMAGELGKMKIDKEQDVSYDNGTGARDIKNRVHVKMPGYMDYNPATHKIEVKKGADGLIDDKTFDDMFMSNDYLRSFINNFAAKSEEARKMGADAKDGVAPLTRMRQIQKKFLTDYLEQYLPTVLQRVNENKIPVQVYMREAGLIGGDSKSKNNINYVDAVARGLAGDPLIVGNSPIVRKAGKPMVEITSRLPRGSFRVDDKDQQGRSVLTTGVRLYVDPINDELLVERNEGEPEWIKGADNIEKFLRNTAVSNGLKIKDADKSIKQYFNNGKALYGKDPESISGIAQEGDRLKQDYIAGVKASMDEFTQSGDSKKLNRNPDLSDLQLKVKSPDGKIVTGQFKKIEKSTSFFGLGSSTYKLYIKGRKDPVGSYNAKQLSQLITESL
jgi:hypothetical protein